MALTIRNTIESTVNYRNCNSIAKLSFRPHRRHFHIFKVPLCTINIKRVVYSCIVKQAELIVRFEVVYRTFR